MQIDYVGEHLLPGKIGNFFIVLSFVAAILSAISYFIIARSPLLSDEERSWQKLGRTSFRIHSIAILGIIGTLFYIILNHYFEYQYVWQHSSKALPVRYMLSCFWEGQEGSFLLWSFWHIVLGNVLIKSAGTWEAPVMTVFAAVQLFLASMILGIYVGDYKIGSNPFILLREHPDYANLPFIQIPTYLANLDGRGLNPLLQNYWMTIHPPTLFLGFASTLVPFAYAISGLWTKKYNEWIKPALPWTFFGVMILGTGILMGGAWAYEALSFGGFWAWDPVENASLVPWLTFVGAAHVMLINKNNGRALITTLLLTIVTFILILYSTFLTRSGILGDSSVHAFTDLGMSGQLLIYLLFFVGIAAFLFIKRYKELPVLKDEEQLWSREFWMFMGALILFISAFQITFTTSIPVWNKLFGTKLAPPLKPVEHYNSWQIPFSIIIAFMIGFGQYLKYLKTDHKELFKRLFAALSISAAITIIAALYFEYTNFFYILLFFSSTFAVTANFHYFIKVLSGKLPKAGASIAHIGFGLILLGALISTSKSTVISQNTSSVDLQQLGKDFQNNENIMLSLGDSLRMGDYLVSYRGKKKDGPNVYFQIDYLKHNEASGKFEPAFTLNPLVQTNPKLGNIAEPDTKHFLDEDVYTHVTYAVLDEKEEKENNKKVKKHEVLQGDTMFAANSMIFFEGLIKDVDKEKYKLKESDIAVAAKLRVTDINNKSYIVEPVMCIRDNYLVPIESSLEELGLKFNFSKIDVESGKSTIEITEQKSKEKDFIIMKAIIFPFINILWIGCILLVVGSLIAIRHRIVKNKV